MDKLVSKKPEDQVSGILNKPKSYANMQCPSVALHNQKLKRVRQFASRL